MDAKQFLSDLKNINPNNPGGWPWPIKIFAFVLMFIAVITAGFFFDWQDQLQVYSRAQAQEKNLKDTFLSKKSEAVNLDLIRKQLLDTQQSFGALLKQLPSKAEMDALLTDINQAGLGRGLQFLLFKPGKETVKGVLTEQPISIKVEGSYDDLGMFASDIAQLPRIVTITDISISPGANDLTMTATANTYRYREENEIAGKPHGGAKK
jgi:type IV pilus assembly protein PilO